VSALLVAVAALSGLVLLLAVPVEVAFRGRGVEPLEGRVTIRWLFGLVRFRVPVPGVAKPKRPDPGAEPETEEAREKPKKRGGRTRALSVLGQAAFRRRLCRLVRDLVRAAHPSQLGLHVRLGLGDPADTGRLWGFVGPLVAAAGSARDVELRIEPEFEGLVCEFEAHGRLLLVPVQFLFLAVVFALSPTSIRAWRTLRGHA